METTCPQCHVVVRATDYFCYNCGKRLKRKPPETTVEKLILYYLGSIVLPPMGIIWGLRFVQLGDKKSKTHGVILIVITIVEIYFLTIWTIGYINGINKQIDSQINGLGF